ncbi:hypothetical protein [Segatella albensis]|jgi:hypothetical protein|uniref:hypothetical protein n=1 Tax=Segatella albensis TaxID=77768 RepID=UPI000413397C|nr:hypothetical protein [Segatella albensis]
MKRKYIIPTIRVHHIGSSTSILAASNFDGNKETPQNIDNLLDEIEDETQVG